MGKNNIMEQAISLINEKIRFCEEQIHVWSEKGDNEEAMLYTARRMGLLEAIESLIVMWTVIISYHHAKA